MENPMGNLCKGSFPELPTRGSAPEDRWFIRPQTPIILIGNC